jgi:hypothetical protein
MNLTIMQAGFDEKEPALAIIPPTIPAYWPKMS